MSEKAIIPAIIPHVSFKAFLLQNRHNRIVLWIVLAAMIIQFGVFKYFYPFASYIHGDSFVYIDIAFKNSDIDSYMIGYGRFLRLFSVFTTSDTILVGFQYLLLQSGALFLLFSLFYFYRLGKVVGIVLLIFIALNPLFLYLANLVSSDGLFLALSLYWFALLIWTLHLPSIRIIIWLTLTLFFCFTVRYNALIYPMITAAVILLSKMPVSRKASSIGAGFLLCGLFVLYTGNHYKTLTGTWQYSPFSGWLMTNNAMYAYRYVDSTARKPVPVKFKELDNMIRQYFDTSRDVKTHPIEAAMASTVYMWSPGLPLYKYRDQQFKKDTTASELKKWASMGPFYKAYGMYLIKQYPFQYARYFLWPNANKYYAPPVEFLEVYNSGYDQVLPSAQQWFGYKSTKVKTRTKDLHIAMLDFYPITSGIINVVMLCGLVCFVLLKGFRMQMLYRKGVMVASTIWLINAAFTIFASSAALRFQAFPLILTFVFTFSLLDYIWKIGTQEQAGRIPNVMQNRKSELPAEDDKNQVAASREGISI